MILKLFAYEQKGQQHADQGRQHHFGYIAVHVPPKIDRALGVFEILMMGIILGLWKLMIDKVYLSYPLYEYHQV